MWQSRRQLSKAPLSSIMNSKQSNCPTTSENIWFCSSIHLICEFLNDFSFLCSTKWLLTSAHLCSTFVCPTEIIAFSDRIQEFKSINAEVVGVSVDSEFSHLAWCNLGRKVMFATYAHSKNVKNQIIPTFTNSKEGWENWNTRCCPIWPRKSPSTMMYCSRMRALHWEVSSLSIQMVLFAKKQSTICQWADQ